MARKIEMRGKEGLMATETEFITEREGGRNCQKRRVFHLSQTDRTTKREGATDRKRKEEKEREDLMTARLTKIKSKDILEQAKNVCTLYFMCPCFSYHYMEQGTATPMPQHNIYQCHTKGQINSLDYLQKKDNTEFKAYVWCAFTS